MKHLAVLICLLALGACGDSHPPAESRSAAPAPGSGERPLTIPALREWSAGSGEFRLLPGSRIVVTGSDAALRAEAETLAADLLALKNISLPVIEGAATAGDIALSLGASDAELGDEGYSLRIGDNFSITANTTAGVFYGTRSLLQMLAQGDGIPAGQARDWPRYPERGLLVDCGRKFFTPEWFHAHVRELGWLKLNLLQIHFSENLGFRIESEQHPEIVSEQHLSKDQVRELVALAARYHVKVLGEIGMPGHMGAALAPHPELQLANTRGEKAPDKLDITNPAARQYALALIEEYLPLFPGVYWHAGGDEYLPSYSYASYPQLQDYARAQYGPDASGRDAVLGFMNEIDGFVRAQGRVTRFWHDGVSGGTTVSVNTDTVIDWWTDFNPLGDLLPPPPQEFLDRGHVIVNASYWPLYYTVGAAAGFPPGLPPRPDLCSFYEGWEVDRFTGPLNPPAAACQTVHLLPSKTVAADEPRNLGAKLFVFTDGPDAETETEIAQGIAPRLRIVAQKTWNSPPLTARYAEFEPVMAAIGHAPGYQTGEMP